MIQKRLKLKKKEKKTKRKKCIEFSLVFYKNSVARKKVEIRRCTNQTQIGLHDYTESITKRQEKKKRIGYIAFFVKQGIKGEHFCQRKTYNRCNSELST
jgi:hypothetical protein